MIAVKREVAAMQVFPWSECQPDVVFIPAGKENGDKSLYQNHL
ncbi:MAG: hypothetical protein ACLSW1_08525 [Lachnospira sp.]